MYPNDYTAVRAGGKYGDMKNDGYCYISRKFFQAHASRGESISKIETKIINDLTGVLKNKATSRVCLCHKRYAGGKVETL